MLFTDAYINLQSLIALAVASIDDSSKPPLDMVHVPLHDASEVVPKLSLSWLLSYSWGSRISVEPTGWLARGGLG